MKSKFISRLLVLTVPLILGACGGIQAQVDQQYSTKAQDVSARIKEVTTARVSSNVPTVQRTSGAWLGGQAVPLQADSSLPEIFRQPIKLRFPGRHNLATIAERITKVTGIPVSVKPDVFMSPLAFVKGGGAANQQQADKAANPVPGPAQPSLNSGVSSTSVSNFSTDFEMNYEGTLAGYLDLICSRAGISWEYREGVISLHRLVTRILTLAALPGNNEYTTSVGKTSDSKAGSSNTAAGFNAESKVKTEAKTSVWKTIDDAIGGMLSPSGHKSISEATGTITVTDTREIVDQVARYVEHENAIIKRQVAMRVEVISVQLSQNNEYGLDWNAVMTNLSNTYQIKFTSPATTNSNATSGLGFSVLAPLASGAGSNSQQRLSGSSAIIKALDDNGRVVSVTTTNPVALNRQSTPIAITKDKGYVASTTPAPAGLSGAVGGTPGLTQATVTTGYNLNVLPVILDSNSILLQMNLSMSQLDSLLTFTSGQGANQQSIQTPEVSSSEYGNKVAMRPGETLVLTGYEKVVNQYDRRALSPDAPVALGGSFVGSRNREAVVILVTPVLVDGAN